MLLLSFLFSTTIISVVHANKGQPNIVFIMADDLGYGDLGCYGQQQIKTPHIDRLAAEGMRFTQAYAGGCVCTPSRSCLMTGLHGGHTPARDNVPHYPTYLQETDVTIAEVLKQAGYRCGGIGKWSLGDAGTVGRATRQGFDKWFGYLNQDHAHHYYPEYLDDDESRLELTGNSKSHDQYSHDLMTEQALKFIRESKDRAFFLYAAYTVPHFGSPVEDPTRLPVPSDSPYSDKPWDQKAKNYAAMITHLDADVGRIVRLIDELGLATETLIIFTSDHGPWGGMPRLFDSAGPLRGKKRELYEGGIRVPFIARRPGYVPARKLSDEVIAFWDMMPTFAELAGAEAPADIDGISVAAALRGEEFQARREYLYWDYGHNRTTYHQAVRIGDWKALRHGQGGRVELYDLSGDLAESHNVADQHAEIVSRIEQIMRTAVTPSRRYQVGKLYEGGPIWQSSVLKGRTEPSDAPERE
ncbi:MAG TPA: N-acetylgalactosamine 6-sulfate sulfatase [Verrucomicrobiales bacterium]|nr:N-acetylgalactosamine 6-sulfate sulfatase [Verrucomicrobiales bacterium]